MPRTRVDPATARLRARLVTIFVLLVVAGLTTAAGLAGTASDTGIALVIFAWLVVLFLPWLPWGIRPVLHGTDLTAWTFSGRRTLDLRRLADVKRVRIIGTRPELDALVLLDTDGVRLFVNRPAVDDAVLAAVTDPDRAEPRVSAFAGHRLGLVELPLGRRALHALGMLTAWLLYVFLTLFAVLVVAVVVAMSSGSVV